MNALYKSLSAAAGRRRSIGALAALALTVAAGHATAAGQVTDLSIATPAAMSTQRIAAEAAAAVEVSRAPYRKFATKACTSDECVIEYPAIGKNRRLDARYLNCGIRATTELSIIGSRLQIRKTGTTGGPTVVVPLTAVAGNKRFLGANVALHLPVHAGELLSLQFNDDSSRNWTLECSVTGELVRLKP